MTDTLFSLDPDPLRLETPRAHPTPAGPRPLGSQTAVGDDLSLTATGIASSDGWCTVHGRTGLSSVKMPLADRAAALRRLATEIRGRIGKADLVLIESPALSRARGGVFERGYVWWRVVDALTAEGVPVVEVTPPQLKLFVTGKGRASKGEVMVAVTRRFPMFDTKGDDNMSDAAVLAAMGAHLLGAPLTKLPTTHLAALEKLRVPDLPAVAA